MNTGRFYYDLMKLNVLSSSYVTDCYKSAWENNVYPIFHDTEYTFHEEVAKYFYLADEKLMNKACDFLDGYTYERADFTDFEAGLEKMLGQGNVLPVLDYCFQSKQYLDVLTNLRLNRPRFSAHFINRMDSKGYWG